MGKNENVFINLTFIVKNINDKTVERRAGAVLDR